MSTGGGGGNLARIIRLSTTTLEPFHLGFPKLVTSYCDFHLDTFWRNFRRINLPGGCCSHRTRSHKNKLRLLTHVRFFRQNSLILSEVFCIGKGARIMKKIYHNCAKKFILLRRFDHKNTVFGISRNLSKSFQMTLNARKSCADSFLKIKTDDNRARFSRNQQNSEKFDREPRNSGL